MSNYYLTIKRNGGTILHRHTCDSFEAAIDQCSLYYKQKGPGNCYLQFTQEVIAGFFARAYTQLILPSDIDADAIDWDSNEEQDREAQWRYNQSVGDSNQFEYDASYIFIVESDAVAHKHKEAGWDEEAHYFHLD